MVKPNPEFTEKVVANGGASALLCFQCGTCSASCPSGKETSYRVRKLIRQTQLGLDDDIFGNDDLWQCTTCYACVERCPRQVEVVEVVTALRNIAVQQGKMGDGHKKVGENFMKYGATVNINDKVKEQRKALGLSEVPPIVMGNAKAMEDFQKIIKATGFDKLIG